MFQGSHVRTKSRTSAAVCARTCPTRPHVFAARGGLALAASKGLKSTLRDAESAYPQALLNTPGTLANGRPDSRSSGSSERPETLNARGHTVAMWAPRSWNTAGTNKVASHHENGKLGATSRSWRVASFTRRPNRFCWCTSTTCCC